MDSTDRKIACEMLDSTNVGLTRVIHETYRVANVYRDGLTDKERSFLLTRHKDLEEQTQKIHKLTERLRHHGC